MADIAALGSIINKAANLGFDTAPENVEMVLEVILTVDDSTKKPTGVIVNVERLIQGEDEYIADSATVADGYTTIELAKKV